jgi:RecG-like helicase
MKKATLILTGIATFVVLSLATPTFGADEKDTSKGKGGGERTITGEGMCAKCSLKEADKCQNVIEVTSKKNGTKTKIYVVDNDMAKEFHKNICKENKKVTATGTVKTVDGKREITVTKIEVVKE